MSGEILKGWMNKAQCCEFLGVTIHALDNYCMGGRNHTYPPIPRTILGGRAYFDREQVRAWAEARGARATVSEWETL